MSEWSAQELATPVADAAAPTTPAAAAPGAKPEVPKNDLFAVGRLGKNITLNQFSMYAPSVKNPEKQLRLNVGISGTGYPFMNTDADDITGEKTKENNFGKLNARLGGTVFYSLLTMLKLAKTKESGWKMGLQNFHNYINGKRVDKPQLVNDVLIGVDADGCVWMTVVENGRESVRFFFGPSDWHTWKKGDGEVATRKEMNHWSLDGYVNGVGQAMSTIIGLHAVAGTGDEKFAGGSTWTGTAGSNNNWKDRAQGGGGGWKGNGGGGWKGGQGGQGGWKGNGGGGWKGNNQGGGGGGWKGNQGGGNNGGGWKGNNQGGGGNWNKGGNNFGGGGQAPDITMDDIEL